MMRVLTTLFDNVEGPDYDDRGLASGGAGKYVHPNQKRSGILSGTGVPDDRDNATIRVTNLSEDTGESDLKDLFGRFGRSLSELWKYESLI